MNILEYVERWVQGGATEKDIGPCKPTSDSQSGTCTDTCNRPNARDMRDVVQKLLENLPRFAKNGIRVVRRAQEAHNGDRTAV